jgi:hypothetical protein
MSFAIVSKQDNSIFSTGYLTAIDAEFAAITYSDVCSDFEIIHQYDEPIELTDIPF